MRDRAWQLGEQLQQDGSCGRQLLWPEATTKLSGLYKGPGLCPWTQSCTHKHMYTYSELKPRNPQLLVSGWWIYSVTHLHYMLPEASLWARSLWIHMETERQTLHTTHYQTQHLPAGDSRLGSTFSAHGLEILSDIGSHCTCEGVHINAHRRYLYTPASHVGSQRLILIT